MVRLDMKNDRIILIEKQLKYQPYHQAKFVLAKIYYHLIDSK